MPLSQEDEALTKLILAMSKPFEQGAYARGLPEDEDVDPYAPVMSVKKSPAWVLPWLANFVGELVPEGTDPDRLRTMLLGRYYQKRGKPKTVIDLVKSYLNFPQYVLLEENAEGSMFKFNVYIRTTQIMAGTTVNEIKRAIAAIKPAGYTFTLNATPSITWQETLGTWNAAQGPWNIPGTPPNP